MEKCSKCGDVANIRMYGIDYCASCMLKVFNNGFQNKEIKKEDKIMERHICKHCEKSIDVDTTNDYVEYEDGTLCCKECADEKYFACEHCDEYIIDGDYQEIDGHYYCQECFENNFVKCYECGNHVYCENTETDYYGHVYCSSCFEEVVNRCECCGDYHHQDDGYTTAYDEYICQSCYEDNYFTCDDCGYIYHCNNMYCNEDEDNCYCEDCYEEHSCKHIYSWGYKPNPIFHSEDNEERNTNLHVGIELEIQGNSYSAKKSFTDEIHYIFDEEEFYMKSDGSLDEYGVEIISHPMTYQYMMNNTDWYKIFRLMEKYNMNDTDNCGLHFHIDKEYLNPLMISTIDYMVNNFSEYFSEIGGRTFDECSRYCKKMNKQEDDWGKRTDNESRYQAVNLTNSNTIELRFCKSTDDFETFIVRLKMIFAIVEFAKKFSMKNLNKFDNAKFESVFNKFMKDNFFKEY